MSLAAEAANLAVWEWDLSTDEVWTTATHREHPGAAASEKRTLESFIGRIHINDRERVRQALKSAINSGGDFASEFRFMLPDGRVRWATARGRCVKTPDGKNVRFRGVSLDVTKEKEAQDLFRLAADGSRLGVWHWDEATKTLSWDGATRDMFGVSPDATITVDTFYKSLHPSDADRVKETWRRALELRLPYEIEFRTQRTDGTVRWIHGRGRGYHDEAGKPLSMTGVVFDITELMNKEEALREFEERVTLAARAANLGVWEMDTTTNEIWMSDMARTLYQFDSETRVDHAALQHRVHPEDRELRNSAVKTAIQTQSEYEIEYRLLLPDGTLRWIGGRGRCVTGENRKGARLIGVSIDITPRKLAEAEAREYHEQVGHLSRLAAVGELAASIAHEVNQPLSGIISNAGAGRRLLDRGDVELRELRELLDDIVADGRRAGDVIRGVQSMVRKDAPARQRVNLNDLVINVARMVNPAAMLQSCDVETLLEPNLPTVEADPIQLQQVLLNLVINSFDAMRDTPLSSRKVVITTERNADDAIRASVRDYGVGISEEARDRIFDHFFTTKAQGLGMGLAIVRSIVESHGGTIVGANVEGGGAQFQFVLPASAAPPTV
jgi:PAS domain S-box-containing protein